MNRGKTVLRELAALAGGLFMFFFLTGCTGKRAAPEISRRQVTITATFYPLYIQCLNITQGIPGITVSLLIPAETSSPRDYELSPENITAMASCDILVANGAGMEPFLVQAEKVHPHARILAADGRTDTAVSPYFCLSPEGARYETNRIASELSRLDPDTAAQYESNAAGYDSKLASLSDEMHRILAPYKGNSIITLNDTFGFLADDFGLRILYSVKRSPGTALGTTELLSVVQQIKSMQKTGKPVCLFAEIDFPDSAAGRIETKTGLIVNRLDTCLSGISDPDAYLNAQEKNLLVLRQSLSDSSSSGAD